MWSQPVAGRAPAQLGQYRRRTVTTLPNTSTSSASNTIGSSRGLCGNERDLAVRTLERLHGRLLARDAGDHDVAVDDRADLAAHHVVTVEDARIDHGIAPDPEHEQLAVAREVDRERVQLLDVLVSKDVDAGGDIADERDRAHRPALHLRPTARVEADLDGPWLGRVTAQVAETLQRGEVVVDGGR